MKVLKIIAQYGDLVAFKNYCDIWVVENAIQEDDGKVRVTKLPEGEGQTSVRTQPNGKPMISSQAHSIIVEYSDIEYVTPLLDALRMEQLFYNQHPNLDSKVISFYLQEYSPQYRQAIEIAKTTNHTVLLQVCTNNDQRFYVPVVKEDTIWDARVRYLVYKHYLPV